MRVNVKFTKDFTRNLNVDLVKELLGLHKKVIIQQLGKIPEEKQKLFDKILMQLENAKTNDLIDFTVFGDIHFNKEDDK